MKLAVALRGSFFFDRRSAAGFLTTLLGCCIAANSSSVMAQGQNQRPAPTPSSELGRENLSRVAASAGEIKAVLVKDAGLMVALKYWVAKDATEHGQIVSESDLTNDAIFERLEEDAQFRSVATALVQRYGYLLPKLNPESDVAKEHELTLDGAAGRICKIRNPAIRNWTLTARGSKQNFPARVPNLLPQEEFRLQFQARNRNRQILRQEIPIVTRKPCRRITSKLRRWTASLPISLLRSPIPQGLSNRLTASAWMECRASYPQGGQQPIAGSNPAPVCSMAARKIATQRRERPTDRITLEPTNRMDLALTNLGVTA
jgi:hypothetical protein